MHLLQAGKGGRSEAEAGEAGHPTVVKEVCPRCANKAFALLRNIYAAARPIKAESYPTDGGRFGLTADE